MSTLLFVCLCCLYFCLILRKVKDVAPSMLAYARQIISVCINHQWNHIPASPPLHQSAEVVVLQRNF